MGLPRKGFPIITVAYVRIKKYFLIEFATIRPRFYFIKKAKGRRIFRNHPDTFRDAQQSLF